MNHPQRTEAKSENKPAISNRPRTEKLAADKPIADGLHRSPAIPQSAVRDSSSIHRDPLPFAAYLN
jgi:hypothetical protein